MGRRQEQDPLAQQVPLAEGALAFSAPLPEGR